MNKLMRTTTCVLFMVICTAAVNPKSCSQVNCGSGKCCPDSWLGPVCFDSLKYGCPKDSSGTSTLCGAKLSACSGVCFDGSLYSCINGALVVRPPVLNPITPPTPSPMGAQTADLRIINNCASTLWIEGRYGGQGQPIPGFTNTSMPALPGSFIDFVVPATGLEATRFWGKYGCDNTGKNCKIGDQMQYYPGGGCPPGGCTPPIDSLFEATFGCKSEAACHATNPTTWFDTSQVDGWTIPYKLSASGKTSECDCTSTGCGFSGVDATKLDLSRCPTSEDLSMGGAIPHALVNGVNVSLSSVDLRMLDPKTQEVIGCMSPCKKLTTGYPSGFGLSESSGIGLWACCPTPLPGPQCTVANGCVTAEECRVGPIIKTEYVDVVHELAAGVYAYTYDDGLGLHACPAGTVIYTMEFCPTNSAQYPQ